MNNDNPFPMTGVQNPIDWIVPTEDVSGFYPQSELRFVHLVFYTFKIGWTTYSCRTSGTHPQNCYP